MAHTPGPSVHTLTALSQSSRLRYVVLTALYAAQGVPYGILIVAVPAYLAQRGVPPTAVAGYIGFSLLPASLKVLYGPIMDRWSFLPMGRRRPWVLAGQAGLVAAFLAMALIPDPTTAIAALSGLGFVTYFFTMFQDVATDGMAVDIVPVEEQPRANGFMWGGVVIGGAGTTAGGAWMLSTVGFGTAMVFAAACVAVLSLFPLFFRERPGERLLPWTPGRASDIAVSRQLQGWADIGRSLWRVLLLPASLVGGVAIFVYGLTRGMQSAVLPLMAVQELGWADTAYSNLNATGSLIGGVLGMALGGWLAMRVGRLRFIRGAGIVFAGASLALALLSAYWPVRVVFGTYVVTSLLLDVFIMIAFGTETGLNLYDGHTSGRRYTELVMHPASNFDTSPEIERRQIERWRTMTPAEKATIVTGLTQATFDMARAGVRHRYPDASPREQYLRLAVVTLGVDLAVRAYPEITALGLS